MNVGTIVLRNIKEKQEKSNLKLFIKKDFLK